MSFDHKFILLRCKDMECAAGLDLRHGRHKGIVKKYSSCSLLKLLLSWLAFEIVNFNLYSHMY